jgi:FKBP-type peptidyl-prolyl cis-trans isomerase (trigger factor)
VLIDEELLHLIEELKREAVYSGQPFEAFQKMIEEKEGKKIEEIYRPKALDRVRLRFIMDHIIEELKFAATEQEIDEGIKQALDNAPEYTKEYMKKRYEGDKGRNVMHNQIVMDKIFKHFIERGEHNCTRFTK